MEIRAYNLLRQGKYQYDFIPSELVALAMRRDVERKARLARTSRIWDRVIIIGGSVAACWLTYHVLAWVMK